MDSGGASLFALVRRFHQRLFAVARRFYLADFGLETAEAASFQRELLRQDRTSSYDLHTRPVDTVRTRARREASWAFK